MPSTQQKNSDAFKAFETTIEEITHEAVDQKKTQTQQNGDNRQCDDGRDDRLKPVVKNLYHY